MMNFEVLRFDIRYSIFLRTQAKDILQYMSNKCCLTVIAGGSPDGLELPSRPDAGRILFRDPMCADDKPLGCRAHIIEWIASYQSQNYIIGAVRYFHVIELDYFDRVHAISIGSA
jgi:hypothetical protein